MTLTTEQLRARAKFWREKAVEAKWESVSIAQDMLLNADAFEELAANREAQPVEIGKRSVFTCSSCGAQGLDEPLESRCHCMGDGAHWVESALYTAPPAPAVVKLPTEFHSDEGVMVRLEQVMAALALVGVKYERRGDACRAAMLAAAPEVNKDA